LSQRTLLLVWRWGGKKEEERGGGKLGACCADEGEEKGKKGSFLYAKSLKKKKNSSLTTGGGGERERGKGDEILKPKNQKEELFIGQDKKSCNRRGEKGYETRLCLTEKRPICFPDSKEESTYSGEGKEKKKPSVWGGEGREGKGVYFPHALGREGIPALCDGRKGERKKEGA